VGACRQCLRVDVQAQAPDSSPAAPAAAAPPSSSAPRLRILPRFLRCRMAGGGMSPAPAAAVDPSSPPAGTAAAAALPAAISGCAASSPMLHWVAPQGLPCDSAAAGAAASGSRGVMKQGCLLLQWLLPVVHLLGAALGAGAVAVVARTQSVPAAGLLVGCPSCCLCCQGKFRVAGCRCTVMPVMHSSSNMGRGEGVELIEQGRAAVKQAVECCWYVPLVQLTTAAAATTGHLCHMCECFRRCTAKMSCSMHHA
jgi:hypothetical protein